jgi:hypothetical protein
MKLVRLNLSNNECAFLPSNEHPQYSMASLLFKFRCILLLETIRNLPMMQHLYEYQYIKQMNGRE